MSISANIHVGNDAAAKIGVPTPGAQRGWLTVNAGASHGDNQVTIFPPENHAAALVFLHDLAEKARELALMIDASHVG